jgi:hypothetical protein
MLDLFLPTKRIPDVPVVFEPNQPIAPVIASKTRHPRLSMFFRAPLNVVRHSDIQNMRTARHYINVVVMFVFHRHHFSGFRAK